jgi:hypothetical protein
MPVYGYCPDCGTETVDYQCVACDADEIEKLKDENKRLKNENKQLKQKLKLFREKNKAWEELYGDEDDPVVTWEEWDEEYLWCSECQSWQEGQCICYAR